MMIIKHNDSFKVIFPTFLSFQNDLKKYGFNFQEEIFIDNVFLNEIYKLLFREYGNRVINFENKESFKNAFFKKFSSVGFKYNEQFKSFKRLALENINNDKNRAENAKYNSDDYINQNLNTRSLSKLNQLLNSFVSEFNSLFSFSLITEVINLQEENEIDNLTDADLPTATKFVEGENTSTADVLIYLNNQDSKKVNKSSEIVEEKIVEFNDDPLFQERIIFKDLSTNLFFRLNISEKGIFFETSKNQGVDWEPYLAVENESSSAVTSKYLNFELKKLSESINLIQKSNIIFALFFQKQLSDMQTAINNNTPTPFIRTINLTVDTPFISGNGTNEITITNNQDTPFILNELSIKIDNWDNMAAVSKGTSFVMPSTTPTDLNDTKTKFLGIDLNYLYRGIFNSDEIGALNTADKRYLFANFITNENGEDILEVIGLALFQPGESKTFTVSSKEGSEKPIWNFTGGKLIVYG